MKFLHLDGTALCSVDDKYTRVEGAAVLVVLAVILTEAMPGRWPHGSLKMVWSHERADAFSFQKKTKRLSLHTLLLVRKFREAQVLGEARLGHALSKRKVRRRPNASSAHA